MREFIEKVYQDYKIYMRLNNNTMPNLNPIILGEVPRVKTPIAYVNTDELLLPTVNLYINPILNSYDKRYQVSKLFHEFTHILDGNCLFREYDKKEFMHIMSTYSEYHASQIELIYNIGLNLFNISPKIDIDNFFITSENSKISITTDYLQPMAEALIIIDKPFDTYNHLSAVDYYRNYLWFEAKTMYYLGKENLCQKLSDRKIRNLTSKEYKEFAPYIKNIETNIQNKNYKNLIVARKELWSFYKSHFICQEKYLLPDEP